MDKLIVIKHLKVQGANAIAGLTWGFPAMSNFLGFTHALQRLLQKKIDEELNLSGCAVICHSSQVHAANNNLARETYFSLSRNPLIMKGKNAVTAPFNEEGKMHLDVSLLIHLEGDLAPDEERECTALLSQHLPRMRVAGGMVEGIGSIELVMNLGEVNREPKLKKRLLRSLLPGFALVSRHDILQNHIAATQKSPLDAWLDFSKHTRQATTVVADDGTEKTQWATVPLPYGGWLKPISVGYQGISKLYGAGEVGHVRDREVPAQFVESIYSLGQWISPHRITDIRHLFWSQSYDPEQSLYLCENNYVPDEPLNETSELTTSQEN